MAHTKMKRFFSGKVGDDRATEVTQAASLWRAVASVGRPDTTAASDPRLADPGNADVTDTCADCYLDASDGSETGTSRLFNRLLIRNPLRISRRDVVRAADISLEDSFVSETATTGDDCRLEDDVEIRGVNTNSASSNTAGKSTTTSLNDRNSCRPTDRCRHGVRRQPSAGDRQHDGDEDSADPGGNRAGKRHYPSKKRRRVSVFHVLIATWILIGVGVCVWRFVVRQYQWQGERRLELRQWCSQRAMLLEQQLLAHTSQTQTLMGLVSSMGRVSADNQWGLDTCLSERRWQAYLSQTTSTRPGGAGAFTCLYVTHAQRRAFELRSNASVTDAFTALPRAPAPLYCAKVLDFGDMPGAALLSDALQAFPSELALVRDSAREVFTLPYAMPDSGTAGLGVVFPLLQLPLPASPSQQQQQQQKQQQKQQQQQGAVVGAVATTINLTAVFQSVLAEIFYSASTGTDRTFEFYDTTDPSAPLMLAGPTPLLFQPQPNHSVAPLLPVPPSVLRPWEKKAVVNLTLPAAGPRSYQVWCRFTQPPSQWVEYWMPILFSLLVLALTALVAAVAWLQRRQYEQSRQAAAEADGLREEAEGAERSKSCFVASMTHELRTPMIGIIGMLDVLSDSHLSKSQHSDLSTARSSALKVLKLVNQVLDLSKLEVGRMQLESGGFDVHAWVEGEVRRRWGEARERNVHLAAVVDPSVPPQLVGDQLRLAQALSQVMDYALSFTPHGGYVLVRVAVADSNVPMTQLAQLNETCSAACSTRVITLIDPYSATKTGDDDTAAATAAAAAACVADISGLRSDRQCYWHASNVQSSGGCMGSHGFCKGGNRPVSVDGNRAVNMRGNRACKGEKGAAAAAAAAAAGSGQMQLVITCEHSGCDNSETMNAFMFRFEEMRSLQEGAEEAAAKLSLVLAKQLVTLMKGDISCKVDPATGTAFTLAIPVLSAPPLPQTTLPQSTISQITLPQTNLPQTNSPVAKTVFPPAAPAAAVAGEAGVPTDVHMEGDSTAHMHGDGAVDTAGNGAAHMRGVGIYGGDMPHNSSGCLGVDASGRSGFAVLVVLVVLVDRHKERAKLTARVLAHLGASVLLASDEHAAARLIADPHAFHQQSNHFCSHQHLAKFCGKPLVVVVSGEAGLRRFRQACDRLGEQQQQQQQQQQHHHHHHHQQHQQQRQQQIGKLLPLSGCVVLVERRDSTEGAMEQVAESSDRDEIEADSLHSSAESATPDKSSQAPLESHPPPCEPRVLEAGAVHGASTFGGVPVVLCQLPLFSHRLLAAVQALSMPLLHPSDVAAVAQPAVAASSPTNLPATAATAAAAATSTNASLATDSLAVAPTSATSDSLGKRMSLVEGRGRGEGGEGVAAAVGKAGGGGGAEAPGGEGRDVLNGLRILVVDDTGVNLVVARRTLSRCGAAVATAGSGVDAVRRVKEALAVDKGAAAETDESKALDVVLMDLQMPGMDGFASTKAIRQMEAEAAAAAAESAAGSTAEIAEQQSQVGVGSHAGRDSGEDYRGGCTSDSRPGSTAVDSTARSRCIDVGSSNHTLVASTAKSIGGAHVNSTRPLVIIALTADVDAEVTRQCLAGGFHGILQKPIQPSALRMLLQPLVGH
ncbi:hypothetical protein CLOP_g8885 [Closterium sp. NIES-67]|nr:hypothetical protein CLOP_g8885 [Closterium sp. NIES-67]